jgi:type IV secretory pathway TrbL component
MSAIITILIIGVVIGIIVTLAFLWWAVKQNKK